MAAKKKAATISVGTPNVPGRRKVDATKYSAMEKVLMRVMPKRAPGLSQAEMMRAVAKIAPSATFPKKTYQWWAKCVQLDLEVRGMLKREGKPIRWYRAR